MKKTHRITAGKTSQQQPDPITPGTIPPQIKAALQQLGIINPETITTRQAAAYLSQIKGVPTAPSSLEVYRCQSRGPKYKKINSRVFYCLQWLDEYAQGVEVIVYDPTGN